MEQNFQTSFIPKKPFIRETAFSSQPVSAFLVISLFVFLTVVLATGGLYFYKTIRVKKITELENTQVLDKQLKAASEILSKHSTVIPIFEVLEQLTMKTVRFTRFSYSLGTEEKLIIKVKMSGVAIGYRSIALQSDLFAKNKNLIDPVFSNLTLDNSGNVVFDLEFSVDPNFVNYQQALMVQS